MKAEVDSVTLANLARGGVMERFDDAVRLAIENIMDPNTTLAKREIHIRIILKPNEARDFCETQIHTSTKLAASKPLGTQLYVGLDAKRGPVAMEHNPQQLGMPFDTTGLVRAHVVKKEEEPVSQNDSH